MIIKNKNILYNENILMITYALMSFSIGIWANYRSLWLESRNISLDNISLILSISFICSAIISIIISLVSSKIKIKNLMIEIILIRVVSLLILRYTNNLYTLIVCVLLSIICELIYMLSSYPLLSFIDDTDEGYKKKITIEYLSNDIGIIMCGILFGFSIGNYIINYDSFLIISLISSLLSIIFFIYYNDKNILRRKDNNTLQISIKNIFSLKSNRIYLFSCFFVRVSYGLVFDFIMIILTNKLNFSLSLASIFIIASNMIGNLACIFFNRLSDKLSVKKSILLKFGIRAVFYLLAFSFNTFLSFILCICISYITSKILDNKVTGVFIRENSNKDKFLFENIRYFIECLGEGVGAYLAGLFLNISLRILFLYASIITIIQTIILIYNTRFIKKY